MTYTVKIFPQAVYEKLDRNQSYPVGTLIFIKHAHQKLEDVTELKVLDYNVTSSVPPCYSWVAHDLADYKETTYLAWIETPRGGVWPLGKLPGRIITKMFYPDHRSLWVLKGAFALIPKEEDNT